MTPTSPHSPDGPLISYRTLTLMLTYIVVGLALAVAAATATPFDALATFAIALAVVSLLLQVQFYISQERAQREADTARLAAQSELRTALTEVPQRTAALLQQRTSNQAESPPQTAGRSPGGFSA